MSRVIADPETSVTDLAIASGSVRLKFLEVGLVTDSNIFKDICWHRLFKFIKFFLDLQVVRFSSVAGSFVAVVINLAVS